MLRVIRFVTNIFDIWEAEDFLKKKMSSDMSSDNKKEI